MISVFPVSKVSNKFFLSKLLNHCLYRFDYEKEMIELKSVELIILFQDVPFKAKMIYIKLFASRLVSHSIEHPKQT